MGGRTMKRRQEIEKRLQRETRQHLEYNWLAGNSFERQHLDPPPFLEPERYHTIAALFPIKSNSSTITITGIATEITSIQCRLSQAGALA